MDSILTFSDYDQDTDPEGHQAQAELKFHPLGRSRARRQKAQLSPGPPTAGSSFKPDALSLDGQRRQRRCSEPAVAYLAKLRSTGGLTVEDEDGEEEAPLTLPGVRSAVLEESPPSLSSERPWVRRRGLYAPKAHVTSTMNAPDAGTKETLGWGPLKSCQGLHPNSWLKKNRRLSLTQQEKLEIEDEDKCGVSLLKACQAEGLGSSRSPECWSVQTVSGVYGDGSQDKWCPLHVTPLRTDLKGVKSAICLGSRSQAV